MREKQVQIPQALFFDLIRYFCLDDPDPDESSIRQKLENKLNAMVLHDLYSKYKQAPTEEQRAAARQEYLDRIGMNEKYRYSNANKQK